MKGVNLYIDVPTEIEPYDDEVVVSEAGIQCDIHIPDTEIVESLNVISQKINDIHEEYTLSKNTMDLDVVITQINNVFNNYQIDAQFNKIIDMSKTYLTDVQVNNKYVQNIEVELQQVQKKITEINITNVTNALQVTSNNVNILTKDVQALQQLMLKMFGNRFKYNKIEEKWEALEDSPVKRIRCDAASTSTEEPPETDGDIKMLPPPEPENENESILNMRAVKLRRTETKGGGVSIPTRVMLYNNAMATVDEFNTQYSMDCYGLFEMEVINEIPLLENVPIVINQNYNQGVPFTWNILRDYIQDPDLNQDNYNPIGAMQFSITVDVPQTLPENVEHNKEAVITSYAGEVIQPTSPYTTMDQVTVVPRLENSVWSTNGVKFASSGFCGFGVSRVAVPCSVQPLTISYPDQVIDAPSGTDSDGLNYVGYYPITMNININNVPNTVSIPTSASYSISDYNNAQDPVTNYVGFSSVICNNYTGYDSNNPITQNGSYSIPSGYSGYGSFNVNVPLEFNVTKFNIGFRNGNPGGSSQPNPTWEDISVNINSTNFITVPAGNYYPSWNLNASYRSQIVIIIELDMVNGEFKLIPIFFTTSYSSSKNYPVQIVNDSGVDKIWYIHKEYVGTYYESDNSVKKSCKFRNCDLVYDTDKTIFGNTINNVYDFYDSTLEVYNYNSYYLGSAPSNNAYIKNYSSCNKYYTVGKINPSLINFPNLV